ncbi:MAG TPA: ATP-dependent Clp protease ATP-binding subunit [Myxococcales bacterium]|nr:ATP-dependent Clp protease ATP-binding subunit [Myxococcales bacterium]
MATDSPELSRIAAEALDIAKSAGQAPTTAHLLLATFTVPGAADVLLRERGCDEDRVLDELSRARAAEPAELFAQALERARRLADDCASPSAEGLHLLVALARLSRSAAAALLDRLLNLPSLRTTALGYLTGSIPRRRVTQEVRVGTSGTAERQAYARPSPAIPRAAPLTRAQPSPSTSTPPSTPPSPSTFPSPSAFPSPSTSTSPSPPPSISSAPSDPPPISISFSAPRAAPTPDAAAQWALDPREFPYLCAHGRNLSALASMGQLDPALGREAEVEEVLDILGKRRANNPVLVGEPGVGKTAIVEGLAQRLVDLQTDRIVLELDLSGLVAGTQLRGSFSERLLGIKEEVRRAEGRVVVFIDELHMLIGAGSSGEGPQDAANELKAALARGEFPCVGATTHDEFRRHVQGDPALERRFVPVLVREPTARATVPILRGAAARYEEHHGVRFRADALEAAALLTARYVRDRCLPDKAFAAIDLAGSRVRRESRSEVLREDVARAVARMAGLPEERLLQPDGERFLSLERKLQERIVGHAPQLAAIARAVRRNYAGFSAQRPLASFLFVGPSGVGKTETARVLAEELYPASEGGTQPGALVRIDLSEYSEAHSVARLVGAPPGYVGYGEGGQLTEAVRRRPACVVLLDEVEKAHPSVLQLLLQVLDEGQLTDGRGRRIDFSGAVVVLTGNVGASAFGGEGRAVGFGTAERADAAGPEAGAARALDQARAAFPPELWGRLDERLVFAPLGREEVARIADLLLSDSSRRLWEERQIAFRTGPGLVDHLIAQGGWQLSLGARPMRQTIQRLVESPLADEILAGRIRAGERLLACAGPAGVEFRREG